jgi:hypothetical protein
MPRFWRRRSNATTMVAASIRSIPLKKIQPPMTDFMCASIKPPTILNGVAHMLLPGFSAGFSSTSAKNVSASMVCRSGARKMANQHSSRQISPAIQPMAPTSISAAAPARTRAAMNAALASAGSF